MADSLLIDTTTRIFEDLCDPQTVNAATDAAWKVELWNALEESLLTLAWVPESCGGAGAGITDGFDILAVSGRYAVPVPLAETLLAGWLLAAAGLPSPSGIMTVAPARPRDALALDEDGLLHGVAVGVPFAVVTDSIVVCAARNGTRFVARVNTGDCLIRSAPGLAGDTRDVVRFDRVAPVACSALPDAWRADALMLMGATARAVQIGGALQAVLALATRYARERVAFERTISRFQAVQHNLARLAGEAAATVAAAGSAADAIRDPHDLDTGVFLEAASAKIRAGEAAGTGAAIAHQVHGAIGFTEEHVLHRFTRRLWSWRDDFGNESEWAVQLGQLVASNGADDLWPMLAAR